MIIDLRSDTVTQPTAEMREAMMQAPVGDDVFCEDPTVNELESEVAKLLGKPAALYTPSGTMANQIAINLHTRPGDSVICEERSHTFAYEAGAAAALSGVQFDILSFSEKLSDSAIESHTHDSEIHKATTSLMIVENTHNAGGGRVTPVADLERIGAKCKSLGLKLHCDGARLWNAAVAMDENEADLVAPFDSAAVCFSKGLGAPIGSALVGSEDFIAQARKVRKRLGGGMRQVGFIAGAALYALHHHRARLAEDHARAARFAEGLRSIKAPYGQLMVHAPEPATNMVYWSAGGIDGDKLAEALTAKDLHMLHVGMNVLRTVFHLHIDDAAVDRAVELISDTVAELTP